jgi:uridine phosphorylase
MKTSTGHILLELILSWRYRPKFFKVHIVAAGSMLFQQRVNFQYHWKIKSGSSDYAAALARVGMRALELESNVLIVLSNSIRSRSLTNRCMKKL